MEMKADIAVHQSQSPLIFFSSCLQALYDKKIATFKMSLLCRWSEGGEFESLMDEEADDDMEEA